MNPFASIHTQLKYGDIDDQQAAELLHTRLKRLRLDHTLSSIARLWEDLSDDLQQPQQKRQLWPAIQPHQLAYLATASIRSSNDYRGRPPTRDDLYDLTNLYNQAQGHDVVSVSDTPDLAEFEPFFLRTAYQQFTHQTDLTGDIQRALYLLDAVARRSDITAVFDIPGEFATKTGLSIETFVRLGLAVFILTGGGKGAGRFFEPDDLIAECPWVLTTTNLELFLAQAAATYAEIREIAEAKKPAKPEYEFYRFNPLEARPVVQTKQSGYVVPFPPFLVHRTTTSLYYDLMAVDAKRFPVAFGMAFEAYVGELLGTVYGADELFPEQVYGGKQKQQRSTDWIVVEGTTGTLVECKVARLTMDTKVSADPTVLRRDLLKGVVQALTQLDRVMRDVDRAVRLSGPVHRSDGERPAPHKATGIRAIAPQKDEGHHRHPKRRRLHRLRRVPEPGRAKPDAGVAPVPPREVEHAYVRLAS